jgi:hypothetical protein
MKTIGCSISMVGVYLQTFEMTQDEWELNLKRVHVSSVSTTIQNSNCVKHIQHT